MWIKSCSMKKVFFMFLLASAVLCNLGLDTALIERDLYKDLGLKSGATLKDIKKAFRKLAQVHHPDKSKPSNKEANEIIFREVAAAYEVLSDSAQRQEYDSIRTMRERSSHGKSQQRRGREPRNQQHNNQQHNNDYFNPNDDYLFAEESRYGFSEENRADYSFTRFRPSVVDTMLPANEVIFPYSPILVSPDRQHFALLDMHCSLGVYKGDVDVLIKYLLFAQEPPDLTMMPLELKYRTEGDQSLNGRCFAGLDQLGILRVYRGHPEYPDNLGVLWSSDPPEDLESEYSSYFQRFFLELSVSGELAVRMYVAGNSESQCVWSTTSCNVYMALLKDMRGQVSKVLLELSEEIREIANSLKKKAILVYGLLFDKVRVEEVLKNLKLRFISEATKLRSKVDEMLQKGGVKLHNKSSETEPPSRGSSSGSSSSSSSRGSSDSDIVGQQGGREG